VVDGRVADGCPTPSEPPEPVASPTLVDFDEFSSLCHTGHAPNVLTGAFGRILRVHFSDPDTIEATSLKTAIWHEQPQDTTEGSVETGILIEPIFRWDPQQLGTRPAVYVKRNGMRIERYGINDGLQTGLGVDAAGELKINEGEQHFVGVLGSHTLFCIGRAGAETEILAGEVFREIQHFAPVLRRDLKLKKLAVTEVTEPQQLEEHDQHFAVAVVLGWAYFEKWRLVPQAPWLKGFNIGAKPAGETNEAWLGIKN